MSSIKNGFVVSDYSIMAMVKGLQDFGFIEPTGQDRRDAAEALRTVNEYQLADTDTVQPKVKGEKRIQTRIAHKRVKRSCKRNFSQSEIVAACNCWLAQVDNGKPTDFDFLTIIATIKMLVNRIVEAAVDSGEFVTKNCFGRIQVFVNGTNVKKLQLDLAA